jgi:hypothetical protein
VHNPAHSTLGRSKTPHLPQYAFGKLERLLELGFAMSIDFGFDIGWANNEPVSFGSIPTVQARRGVGDDLQSNGPLG